MKLSRVFNSDKRWTKNALARNKEGDSIDLDYIDRDSAPQVRLLESFSLYGALTWFISYEKNRDERDKTRVKIRNAIAKYTGRDMNIREFNDSPSTKFEDIRNVLAIAEGTRTIKQDVELD